MYHDRTDGFTDGGESMGSGDLFVLKHSFPPGRTQSQSDIMCFLDTAAVLRAQRIESFDIFNQLMSKFAIGKRISDLLEQFLMKMQFTSTTSLLFMLSRHILAIGISLTDWSGYPNPDKPACARLKA